jgi:hypothetical protein
MLMQGSCTVHWSAVTYLSIINSPLLRLLIVWDCTDKGTILFNIVSYFSYMSVAYSRVYYITKTHSFVNLNLIKCQSLRLNLVMPILWPWFVLCMNIVMHKAKNGVLKINNCNQDRCLPMKPKKAVNKNIPQNPNGPSKSAANAEVNVALNACKN